MSLENDQSKVIQGRFHLIKKLGAGSFGEIFEAKDLKTGKVYACKAESTRTKHPQLRLEYQIYRTLAQSKYFVRVWGFVTHYNHQIMIMDKLGDSLEQLFTQCGRKFSIRCVCAIAIQILSRIEELHKHNYLHRDIKPDNFLIGHTAGGDLTSKEAGKIYMIDLGLGKVWKEGGRHIPEKHGKRLIGTPRYASINTHFGQEQSRRDDLESLGYMLMYFAHGQLPWQGLRGQTKEEKYQKIGQKKRDTRLTDLCSGYPDEFRRYLSATQKLQFQEDPPYDQYKQWFRDVLNRHQKTGSYDFDWQNRYYSKQHSKSSSSKRRNSRQHVNNAAAQQPPPQQPQNQAPPTRQQAPPPNQSNQPPPNPVRRNTNNNTNTRGVNINTNPNTVQPQQPPNTTLIPQIHHSNTRNNTNYLSNTRHPTQHHSNHHSSTRRPPTCQQPIHSHSRPQTTANPATAVYPHNAANNPLSLPPLQTNNVIPLIQQNVTTTNPQFSNYNLMDRYQRCKTFFNKQSNNHPQIGINPLTRNTSVNSNSPILQINANATNNINHPVPTNNNTTTQRGNMMFSNPTTANINTSNQNKTLIRDYAKLCSAYKQLEADNMATTRENAELKQELNKLRTEKHTLTQQCHAWKQSNNEYKVQMSNYIRMNTQLKKEKNKQEQSIRTLQHQLNALYGQHQQHQHQRQQVVDTRQPRVYNTSVAQPAQKRRKLNNGMQRRSSNNNHL